MSSRLVGRVPTPTVMFLRKSREFGMVSLLLALVLSSVTSEQQMQQNYASVYKQSIEENKPLMVVVGAEWCPACHVLKDSTIKQKAQTGE